MYSLGITRVRRRAQKPSGWYQLPPLFFFLGENRKFLYPGKPLLKLLDEEPCDIKARTINYRRYRVGYFTLYYCEIRMNDVLLCGWRFDNDGVYRQKYSLFFFVKTCSYRNFVRKNWEKNLFTWVESVLF